MNVTFPEVAAFYAIDARMRLWKSRRFAKENGLPQPDMSGGHLGTGTFGSLH